MHNKQMTPLQKARYRLNLRSLQTQCGENYARLLKLERACEREGELALALAAAGSVRLTITSVSRYTTDMQLTQANAHPLQGEMRLNIRLYHDARLAEITEMHPRQRTSARNSYPNSAMHQPDEKHQWNRFLGEWLAHLEQHGQPQGGNWRAQVSRTAS